ncbi:MAG: toxin HicA [Proteobacteria bacterium]|nr:toxin HicA [Pseudomonadota bacterium]MBS0463783.1 toxin HicA [Pseudomonadota bacterium]
MDRIAALLDALRRNPQNVRFVDLARICAHFFGPPRHSGGSHHVYRTPWAGDPRVNIQCGPAGKAKTYQVRQVLAAIDRLEKRP